MIPLDQTGESRVMETAPPPAQQQQTRMTDYFSKVKNNNNNNNNDKNNLPPIVISLDDESPDKKSHVQESPSASSLINSTPNKRKLNGGATKAAGSDYKRAKSTGKKPTKRSTKTTIKATTTRTIKSMLQVGPRKLDFESALNSTTTTATETVTTAESTIKVENQESAITPVSESQPSPITPSTSSSLNLSDIKKKLQGCKNLPNLKQQLAAINGCADQVKQFKAMRVSVLSPVKPALVAAVSPRKFRSPEKFSLSGLTAIPQPLTAKQPRTPSKLKLSSPYLANCVPNSPRAKLACSRKLFDSDDSNDSQLSAANLRTPDNSPKPKSATTENVIPAYKRHSYLAKSDVEQQPLPLPNKYKRIAELFKKLDYFAWNYKKKQEICTFEKLREKIELSTKKSFDLRCLLQILTTLHRDDKKWFALGYAIVNGTSQLTITPVYPEHVRSLHSVNMLLDREKEFTKCLLEITKQEHLKFIADMKLTITPDQKIYNWHPMFKLDSVPDLKYDMNQLPEKTQKKVKLDNNSKNGNSMLNYITKHVPVLASTTAPKEEVEIEIVETSTPNQTARLNGIPVHLINKVREKEAAAKAQQMYRPPEIEQELGMLGRLPTIVRIIDRYYTSTKAKSHTYNEVVCKIQESLKSSCSHAKKHLDYLLSLELRPSLVGLSKRWLQKKEFSNLDYILLESDYKVVFLLEQIKARVEHLTKQ